MINHYPQNVENRILYYSLITSVLIHVNAVVIIWGMSTSFFKKSLKPIEVTYLPIKMESIPKVSRQPQVSKSIQGKKIITQPDVLAKKSPLSSAFDKKMVNPFEKAKIDKLERPKVTIPESQRVISVSMIKSEKIDNPRYNDYHDRLREKIKQRAYSHISDEDFSSGEVYLTFIILSDGTLKDAQVIEAKSSADESLKEIGLRSIKEASPFPKFPQGLKYPELTFNVVISFKVKEEN